MLKVICVVDKTGTALDRLAKGVAPYHSNLEYHVVDVHPKRPSPEQLQRFEELAYDADILDFQYYRTALMLMERYPWVMNKKKILTHNNPYSITESTWGEFDILVGNNNYITQELKGITDREVEYIPLTVDAKFWTFNREWKLNNRVTMVANRIESKKGILPVAEACKKLGLKFVLVGAISDAEYFHKVIQTNVVEFHEQISDDELRDLYHGAGVFVCNSVDGFESGTLPLLEAMLCGVPVLTRRVGHVPDLYNESNMIINEAEPDDVDSLVSHLEDMMADGKRLEDMRQVAWDSAKSRDNERRAYEYQKLYRKLMAPETPVSIIVPIYDKPEIIRKCLNAIANQDYPNIELIICDDSALAENLGVVQEFAKTVNFPVRHLGTFRSDYGLARARNMGIIEATGKILVFCDQRIIMEPTAVSELVKHLVPRSWVYGSKGLKKDFVENFSCIYREDIVQMGMFNERCDAYGALSQEVRSRAKAQGIRLVYVESAKAEAVGRSKNKYTRRDEIIKSKNWLFKVGL